MRPSASRAHPTFQQLQNDVEVADAAVRARYGSLIPQLSLGGGFSSRYSETTTTIGDFGEPLSQPRALITKTSSSSQSLNLGSITLFDGGAQFRNIGVAKAQREQTLAGIAVSENQLRAGVTRAYYSVVNANRRVDLERRLLAVSIDRAALIQRQFEIAAAKQTDLLGAQLEVANRKQSVADAESNARTQKLNLLLPMGITGEPTFDVATDLPAVIDPATLNADALVSRALSSHPRVLDSRTRVDMASRQASNAKSTRLPRLTLSLPSYNWGATERGLFDAWGDVGAPNNSFSFGVNASLPLFTGFQTSFNIAQSRAALEDQRHSERQVRLDVENSVRRSLIEMGRAHNALVAAQQRADIAQQQLAIAQQEYGVGSMTYFQLEQIISNNDNAQRAVIDAQINLLNARVDLEERLGGPLTVS
jgi:outer membrane protein